MSIYVEANCLQPLLQNDVSNNCLSTEMQAFMDTAVKVSMSALMTPLLVYYPHQSVGFCFCMLLCNQNRLIKVNCQYAMSAIEILH